MLPTIEYAVIEGDIFAIEADVIALKYAQAFYGADEHLAFALQAAGVPSFELEPGIGSFRYVKTLGYAWAPHALFVGVQNLTFFGYPEIRQFATQVLQGARQYAPTAEHVCMTIHGAGFGLDVTESCLAQLEGCLDAIQSAHDDQFPPNLRRISIVERNASRVARLRAAIDQYLVSGRGPTTVTKGSEHGHYLISTHTDQHVDAAARGGAGNQQEPHVFVAMPFDTEMNDVFYYGIEGPIHAMGFLCERMDHLSFTGDVMQWMRRKIETASLVVAEMTGANPNVYLEVGYAWGTNKPTLLVARSGVNLEFDAKGHRCIFYSGIKDLEGKITKEMAQLKAQNAF